MGISCISQVQLPWGSLPGNGHLWPAISAAILKGHLDSFKWSWRRGAGEICSKRLTSEIVEPWTSFPSPLPLQAVWIVTAILVDSYSALVLGICAKWQVTPRICCCRACTLTALITSSELKITGSGVISTIPRGTERGSESRALPRTAGSLAASHHLKGVVRVAAGDVARVVGVCESTVKEIHGCAVSWTLLFGIFKTKHASLKRITYL